MHGKGTDGRQGVAISQLRPAGIGRFGLRRVDVVARSEFLKRGEPIVVVEVEGNRVVVEPLQS